MPLGDEVDNSIHEAIQADHCVLAGLVASFTTGSFKARCTYSMNQSCIRDRGGIRGRFDSRAIVILPANKC